MHGPGVKTLFTYSIMLLLIVGVGCAYTAPKSARLFLSNRYSELEQYVEGDHAQLSSVEPYELPYLCFAHYKLKKYNKLFPCLDQMERNSGKGTPRAAWLWDVSESFHWLRAMAYIDLGNYRKAVQEASRAHDLAVKKDLNPFQRASALSALSLAYALHGDRGNALRYAGLLERTETPGKYTSLRTDILNELAKVHMALGDFDRALAALDRPDVGQGTWRFFTDLWFGIFLEGESLFTYQVLPKAFMRNKSLYQTGRVGEAENGYRDLLVKQATRDNGDIYWLILFDLGKIAEAEGDKGDAIRSYKEAVEVIEQQRSTINTEASRIGFVGDKQQVYHRLIAALLAKGQEAQAFEYVERSKSRALVDLLASKQDFAAKPGTAPAVTAMLQELEVAQAAARAPERPVDSEESRQRSLRGVQITARLRASAPDLASLVTVTALSAQDLQAQILPDETLMEYYYEGEELWVFLLSRESLHAVKLDGANLVAEVSQVRTALQDPRSQRYLALAQALYQRLFKPIEPHLATRDLVLVPHGVLHYLPFSALHDGTGSVIDRYSLRYLPSASVLMYLKDRPAQKGHQLLAFGNPDLDNPQYDLRFAQEEVLRIAKSLPQARVLVRKEATETALRKAGDQFTYLHFAVHGRFDAEEPLTSGLFLARDEDNDGFVSVGDLYSLRLDSELVTLSACETGLSKVHHGDDLVGLTRGFLYAGSRSIVASLWPVDDEATASLMTEFYTHLTKTGKREALRQAQLATKQRLAHPYYWAAFELTGTAQ